MKSATVDGRTWITDVPNPWCLNNRGRLSYYATYPAAHQAALWVEGYTRISFTYRPGAGVLVWSNSTHPSMPKPKLEAWA